MNLFDKLIVSKDEKTQRTRLSSSLLGRDITRLTMSTIFLYMIPSAISKYIVNIMNMYVFGILAGLTGAVWGFVITQDANRRNMIMKKQPWYSYKEYYSLTLTIAYRGFYYFIGIFIELAIIYFLKIY